MTTTTAAFALSLTALAMAAASPAAAECQFRKIAELPIVMQNGRPTVKVQINGQAATFVVASGDFYSMVSTAAAARLGMKPGFIDGRGTNAPPRIRGLGGDSRFAELVRAKDFTFAGTTFHDADFLVGDRAGGRTADGGIGMNLLGPFDTEYDFANGMVRFFDPKGCGDANLAYWATGKPVSRINLHNPSTKLTSVLATAKIDGRTIEVRFSSGDAVSYLSRPAAARAGIRPSTEGVVRGWRHHGAVWQRDRDLARALLELRDR